MSFGREELRAGRNGRPALRAVHPWISPLRVLRRQVFPRDADLLAGVADFLQVVAVAGHPVEARHPLGQQLGCRT